MIKPQGSQITVAGTDLIVDAVQFEVVSEFFTRPEYDHNKLRTAKEITGAIPKFNELLGGGVVQIITTCTPTVSARPITPNDSVIEQMYNRFDLRLYRLTGGPSLAANVDTVWAIAQSHLILLNQFKAYQEEANGDVSYQWLTNTDVTVPPSGIAFGNSAILALENTGITLEGPSLDTTEDNMLIRNMTCSTEYEIPGGAVYRSWTMEIANYVVQPADSGSF